jgi:hypothetical protein
LSFLRVTWLVRVQVSRDAAAVHKRDADGRCPIHLAAQVNDEEEEEEEEGGDDDYDDDDEHDHDVDDILIMITIMGTEVMGGEGEGGA